MGASPETGDPSIDQPQGNHHAFLAEGDDSPDDPEIEPLEWDVGSFDVFILPTSSPVPRLMGKIVEVTVGEESEETLFD